MHKRIKKLLLHRNYLCSRNVTNFDLSMNRWGYVYGWTVPFTFDLNFVRVVLGLPVKCIDYSNLPTEESSKVFSPEELLLSNCLWWTATKVPCLNHTTDTSKYSTCTIFFFFLIERSCGTFSSALLRSATCRFVKLTSGMNTITHPSHTYI